MKKLLTFASVTFALLANSAYAEDLIAIYRQALIYDPTYQAAKAQYKAELENLPQAVAGLLPQLSGSADTVGTRLKSNYGYPNFPVGGVSRYNTHGYTLSLSQPIIDYAQWNLVRGAHSTVKRALADFDASRQDLIIRLSTAYFGVLQAQDFLRFREAAKLAFYRQLEQQRQRYQVGLDPITNVYNAEASYDISVAQVIAAQNDIEDALEELRRITGVYYTDLSPLQDKLPLIKPIPDNISEWVAKGVQENFTLKSSYYAMGEAKSSIEVARAGHLPTVDAVGNVNRDNVGTSNSNGFINKSQSIGLQMNLPIFSGGAVTSQTRQAAYGYQQSKANYEGSYRSVVNDTRQNFNNVISGISKIKADRQAIISNESSLESNEESFKVGTRTIIDVLNAQQQLTQAQQVHAQDQYAYILDTLRLKQAAGTLNDNDIVDVNGWLSQRHNDVMQQVEQSKKNSLTPQLPRENPIEQTTSKQSAVKKSASEKSSAKAKTADTKETATSQPAATHATSNNISAKQAATTNTTEGTASTTDAADNTTSTTPATDATDSTTSSAPATDAADSTTSSAPATQSTDDPISAIDQTKDALEQSTTNN